jgi:hypothetical protein
MQTAHDSDTIRRFGSLCDVVENPPNELQVIHPIEENGNCRAGEILFTDLIGQKRVIEPDRHDGFGMGCNDFKLLISGAEQIVSSFGTYVLVGGERRKTAMMREYRGQERPVIVSTYELINGRIYSG